MQVQRQAIAKGKAMGNAPLSRQRSCYRSELSDDAMHDWAHSAALRRGQTGKRSDGTVHDTSLQVCLDKGTGTAGIAPSAA